MPISQNEIDQVVPELNVAIGLHNGENPDFPLRVLPKKRRNIFLRARKELEDWLEISRETTSAFCDKQSGNIYVVKENIDFQIENMGRMGAIISSRRIQIEKSRLALLSILMHENGHRSCRDVTEPDYIRGTYLHAALQFFEGTPFYHRLKEVDECNGKMLTGGLRVEFVHPDGILNTGSVGKNGMDEFVTDWLTSSALSILLAQNGYFPTRRAALAGLSIFRFTDKIEGHLSAIGTMLSHPQYRLFMRDYLQGGVSRRLCDSAQEKGQFNSEATSGVIGQLTGDLNSFADLMRAVYGPSSDR